jgi:hypothetical protein
MGYTSTILDLGTRLRWVVSFTPLPLYPRYPLDMRLGRAQNRIWTVWRKILLLPGI